MNTNESIRCALDVAHQIVMAYLGDLEDADLVLRPHSQCNSLHWQIGHLILSEHQMLEDSCPGSMPPLPPQFAEQFAKDANQDVDPATRLTLQQFMQLYEEQRQSTLELLARCSPEQLDRPAAERIRDYAPTLGAAFVMVAAHWLMHSGQWVIIRRERGKPIVI